MTTDDSNDGRPDESDSTGLDPVVAAANDRILKEALRQLDQLELNLDDIDARVDPLWALAPGLTQANGDLGDDPDNNGFPDCAPPTHSSPIGGADPEIT